MSAFTLGTDHIDLLVTIAMRIPGFNDEYINIPETARLLGQDMLNENYASVNYRYSEEVEVPVYNWTPVEELQREPLGPLLLLQVLNAVHCYQYQSCEHSAWTDSKSFWASEAIEYWVSAKLTELKWPKVQPRHDARRPPAFEPPTYMAWEWTREKGLDFDMMEQQLRRNLS